MFVEEKRSWLRIVLTIRGSILPRIWRRVAVSTLLGVCSTVLYHLVPAFHATLTPTPFVMIGLPLGIFLGFRNTSSYDRFWEGRKLWGALVNTTRSITRQTLTLIQPSGFGHANHSETRESERREIRSFQEEIVLRVVAYVHALRMHLRGERDLDSLAPHLPDGEVAELEKEVNVPIAILHRIGERMRLPREREWLHPWHVPVIEGSLTTLTDIQGGCERIKATPIPFSYTVLMHRIVAVYCSLLPFGIAETVQWMTPLVVLFVSYAFFGLDAIGEEIEDPFGFDVNDLPLSQLSTMIEMNLKQRIGHEMPEPVRPVRNVLR